jgi:transmembrane sensor
VTDPTNKTPAEVPSAAACAEAAAWIARLHGEDRTAPVEAGFQRWLAANPDHRAAFDMANDIWAGAEHLPKPPTPTFVRWPKAGLVVTLPRALAAAALVAIVAIGVSLYSRDAGLATRVGEQRNLTLEDGTRISLNTASRVHVRYDRTARRVELDEGEAYFEVAKRPRWPFIVIAGGKQVVARGTAFLVRRDEDSLAVTLVEGKVIVGPAGETVASIPTASGSTAGTSESSNIVGHRRGAVTAADVTLVPGQRLTFADHEQPRLDRPPLERVIAWQRGQIILDHTPLADAVAEMNRYSRVTLKIEEPEARRAEVTGIFRIGDSHSFAQAVAETYHLEVADRGGQIVLSGLPTDPGGDVNEK